jgi:hypothetical protein
MHRESNKLSHREPLVYFSGPIRLGDNEVLELSHQIIESLKQVGYRVLSEHVGGRTREERESVFVRHKGTDLVDHNAPWVETRQTDIRWVDDATHLIAVVNTASHGVGMELERAILKPERGLPETHILCLIEQHRLESLSWMIRGIDEANVEIATYQSLGEAISKAVSFLQRHP